MYFVDLHHSVDDDGDGDGNSVTAPLIPDPAPTDHRQDINNDDSVDPDQGRITQETANDTVNIDQGGTRQETNTSGRSELVPSGENYQLPTLNAVKSLCLSYALWTKTFGLV